MLSYRKQRSWQLEGTTLQIQERRWVATALKGRNTTAFWGPAVKEERRMLKADLGPSRGLG